MGFESLGISISRISIRNVLKLPVPFGTSKGEVQWSTKMFAICVLLVSKVVIDLVYGFRYALKKCGYPPIIVQVKMVTFNLLVRIQQFLVSS